ncbi:hypothetical protein GQ457_06G013980 [Hibiscus cannabinus]
METSSSTEGMPRQTANVELQARYTRNAAKNRWEEQGFFFDESPENYGLEPTIHRRLSELGWFRFARQPTRANLNWVWEFYTSNANGEDNVIVHGRRVAANSATINEILGLPNNERSIYALLRGLEEEDYETIKDFLCEQGTEWNTTGKNPHSSTAPRGQIHGGETRLVQEGVHAENGYRRRCPHQISDAHTTNQSCPLSQDHLPLQKPDHPEQPLHSRQTTPDSPLGPAPSTSSSPPPAQSEEATPLHILQLRSQLQRIEAKQLYFKEETKATHPANFSNATKPKPSANPFAKAGNTEEFHLSMDDENDIFDWQSPREQHNPIGPTPQQADIPESSTARQTKNSAPAICEVPTLSPAPISGTFASVEHTMPDTSIHRKGKTPAGRTISRTAPFSPADEQQMTTRPAKRQRRYHIITSDSCKGAVIGLHHMKKKKSSTL